MRDRSSRDSGGVDRRRFLSAAATGLALYPGPARAAWEGGGSLLAPRPTHHEPKAKNLVILFLTGGFSHLDTFDYKPALARRQGKSVPSVGLRPNENNSQPLLPSPFQFHARGQSGLMISELFPNLGRMADELCVIRTLHTDIVEHFQAVLAMHTGSATVPLPSLGSWLSHGLGTLNANLPSYIVLCENLPYAGTQVFSNGFLPPIHQGVRVVPGDDPIPDLAPQARPVRLLELERMMLADLDRDYAQARPDDADVRARIASFDVAAGMMREAPEALNAASEPPHVKAAYGALDDNPKSFAFQCLIARRLVERGARVVEIIDNGSSNNWDSHGDMRDHIPKAARVDRAIAALLADLKSRGLLDQTLVAICTEFGRTPWTDNPTTKGRNHYAKAFTALLAGAGVKRGLAYGETDEFGARIVANPVHVHDYHATILHLMGIDHTRLVYRYAGRDFRLTDVDGQVVTGVLA